MSTLAAGQDEATLRRIIETELRPLLATLEPQRRRVLRNMAIAGGVVLALVLTLLVAASNPRLFFNASVLLLLLPVLLIAAITTVWNASQSVGEYKLAFKYFIVPHIMRHVAGDLKYFPAACMKEGEFKASRLFRQHFTEFRGEDLVEGMVGNTHVRFSELLVRREHRGSKGEKRVETIFRGIFFSADFNKRFTGRTLVLPDTAQATLGRFGQTLQEWGAKLGFQHGHLVKLEDPEFERHFVVYADDQIEARYLLSTSLMRRILDFRHRAGGSIHLSFYASRLFVALPMTRNLFDVSLWHPATDSQPIFQYVHDLLFILEIVENLDLNNRIWNKD